MPITSIPANDRRERFVASGGQTVFSFDFPVYLASDLTVTRLRSAAETTLILGTDYTLTGAGNQAGGSVTLTTGALAGDVLVLVSAQPTGRAAQFVNGGDLPAEALESEFNRTAISLQQQDATIARALQFAVTDPTQPPLPPASTRAGRYLLFDANGNPTIGLPDVFPTPAIIGAFTRNVIDFGAVMDGTTDDTAAVMAAIADLPAAGGDVTVPSGPIALAGTVTFGKAGSIMGRGAGTRIKKTSAAGDAFNLTGAFQTIGNFHAEPTVTQSAGSLIAIASTASRTTVTCIDTAYGAGLGFFRGISYAGIATALVEKCNLIEMKAATGIAVYISAGLDVSLRDILTDGDPVNRMLAGVQVVNSGDVTITDCNLISAITALSIAPGAGQTVASLWGQNTFFDTSNTGIGIVPAGVGAAAVRCRFNGCWASSSVLDGITVAPSGGGTVVGLTFIDMHAFGNGFSGLNVLGSTSVFDIRVLGGAFGGNGIHGINFGADVTNFSVIGADCGPANGFAANGQYGVAVQVGSANNYIIAHNDLKANTLGALIDGGTGLAKILTPNIT